MLLNIAEFLHNAYSIIFIASFRANKAEKSDIQKSSFCIGMLVGVLKSTFIHEVTNSLFCHGTQQCALQFQNPNFHYICLFSTE